MFKSSLHTCTELDHVCEVWLLRGNGEMMRGSVGKLLMCFEFWTWDSEVSSHWRVTFVLCWGYMSIYRVSKLGSPTTSTAPRYISCRFPSLNEHHWMTCCFLKFPNTPEATNAEAWRNDGWICSSTMVTSIGLNEDERIMLYTIHCTWLIFLDFKSLSSPKTYLA